MVIGDALCSFNPAYGQGMTVAAAEALALRELLAETSDSDLAFRFFRRAARIIDVPWGIAGGGDLRLPGVPGPGRRRSGSSTPTSRGSRRPPRWIPSSGWRS